MDLILHLGAHRTGSTTFEKTLAKNADVLRAEGIGVWAPADVRQMDGFSDICNTQQQLEQGEAKAVLKAAHARELLQDNLSEARASGLSSLLISEENILGTMQRNLLRQQLYDNAGWRLKTYAHFLQTPPKRVVLGLRSYGAYWRSIYMFALHKRPLGPFSNFSYELATQPLGWCDLIAHIRAAFPQSELCVWTQEGFRGNEVAIISEALGRDTVGALQPLERIANRGMRVADIPYILRARQQEPEIAHKKLIDKIAKIRGRGVELPEPAMFTAAQDAQMAARYAEDLERLRGGFMDVRLLDKVAA